MNISASTISCGVLQLANINYVLLAVSNSEAQKNEAQRQLDSLITMYTPKCAMIVASLTTYQVDARNLLERSGFVKLGNDAQNPNSQNFVGLFVRYSDKAIRDAAVLAAKPKTKKLVGRNATGRFVSLNGVAQ